MKLARNFYIVLILLSQTFITQILLSQPDEPYGLKERVSNTSFLLSTAGDTLADMDLERVYTNLIFSQPVFLTHANDGTDRLFLVERAGVIIVFQNRDYFDMFINIKIINILIQAKGLIVHRGLLIGVGHVDGDGGRVG